MRERERERERGARLGGVVGAWRARCQFSGVCECARAVKRCCGVVVLRRAGIYSTIVTLGKITGVSYYLYLQPLRMVENCSNKLG